VSRVPRQKRKYGQKIEARIDEDTFEAISQAATRQELVHPQIVVASSSRIRRIAQGCGKAPRDVRLVFKALSASGSIPVESERFFFEMKAGSFAHQFSKEVGQPISRDDVLESVARLTMTRAEKLRIRAEGEPC
jgi:signal recognition particle GTPase